MANMHLWEREKKAIVLRMEILIHVSIYMEAFFGYEGYEVHYCTVEQNNRVSELTKDDHARI